MHIIELESSSEIVTAQPIHGKCRSRQASLIATRCSNGARLPCAADVLDVSSDGASYIASDAEQDKPVSHSKASTKKNKRNRNSLQNGQLRIAQCQKLQAEEGTFAQKSAQDSPPIVQRLVRPQRRAATNAAAAIAADAANSAAVSSDFFLPLAAKKQKAAETAQAKVVAESEEAERREKQRLLDKAEEEAEAEARLQQTAAARRAAAADAAIDFKRQLKETAQDNAALSKGRKVHPFLAKRQATGNKIGGGSAEQGDQSHAAMSQRYDVVPPALPPLHIVQAPLSDATDLNNGSTLGRLRLRCSIAIKDVETVSDPSETRFRMAVLPETAANTAGDICSKSGWHHGTHIKNQLYNQTQAGRATDNAAGSTQASPSEQFKGGLQPDGTVQTLLSAFAAMLTAAEQSANQAQSDIEDAPTPTDHHQRLRRAAAMLSKQRVSNCTASTLGQNYGASPNSTLEPSSEATSAGAMWTQRYQPQKPSQVCGNTAAVSQLQKWLASWQESSASAEAAATDKGESRPRASKRRRAFRNAAINSDDDWEEEMTNGMDTSEDDDDECMTEDGGAPAVGNHVMLTGPVGCGKTSAAYAVAEAAGYRVIEVNATASRTGATVMNLVGEATRSQRMHAAAAEGMLQGGASQLTAPVVAQQVQPEAAEPRPNTKDSVGSKGKADGGCNKGPGVGRKAAPAAPSNQPKIASLFGLPKKRSATSSTQDNSASDQHSKQKQPQGDSKVEAPSQTSPQAATRQASPGSTPAETTETAAVVIDLRTASATTQSLAKAPKETLAAASATTSVADTSAVAAANSQQHPPARSQSSAAKSLLPPPQASAPPGVPGGTVEKAPLTLLLFDEVDNLQAEDRGFLAALQDLLSHSRCPIIMTSNAVGGMVGALPAQRIALERPAVMEVLECLVLILSAEQPIPKPATAPVGLASVHMLKQLQRIVQKTDADLRQSILTAQLAAMGGLPMGSSSPAKAVGQDLSSAIAAEHASLLCSAASRNQGSFKSATTTAEEWSLWDLFPAARYRWHRGSHQHYSTAAAAQQCEHKLPLEAEDFMRTDDLQPLEAATVAVSQNTIMETARECARAADDALAESVREAATHTADGRWERHTTIRAIAAVHRLQSLAGNDGEVRSRRRCAKQRSYLENALSLEATSAERLMVLCNKVMLHRGHSSNEESARS